MPHRRIAPLLLAVFAALLALLPAAPAVAHTYSATVYAEVTEPQPGLVHAVLDIEYVLLAVDGGAAMGDSDFTEAAYDDVQASGQDPTKLTPKVLDEYSDTVLGYVQPRFDIAVAPGAGEEPEPCASDLVEPLSIVLIENVPHAHFVLDYDCRASVGAAAPAYRISTQLFPSTGPGGKTTTVLSYDTRSGSGVANLDTDTSPTVTTVQDWGSRMWEFFLLGAEHLLTGLDHILFLLALIVGSRRLRDIVLAASAFTVAHSLTFILAALGVVSVPAIIVEPLIAASIAFVAIWYLYGVWRRRPTVIVETAMVPPRAPMRGADWLRVGVVFLFGLIHGVGFAGALGIDEPFSWGLLGALLVFNVGIEVVQLSIIAIVFPIMVLLRRRFSPVGFWVGVAVSAGVAVVGLYWFVERLVNAA
ncbi:HupE/UreJ family protein [Herbiconiux sp. CPCC 205763]|uniref:HupE/UreJ family protein n=1 Tax=Herbiconiux aconitum TaxID=2970913 RepID=A0ABT2GUK1_9MICO|nr:HupE/UreJ family protein [Herbiconiux aconitum]MCS5719222.1 HupE/UreJ family protein [Herbiconiux aconitum]